MSERTIFLKAVEIVDIAGRAALLDAECAGDEALRQRVKQLLSAHDTGHGILDRPAVASQPAEGIRPMIEGSGTLIGPYKLLEQIGEGGMGVVYMAEQHKPVRRKVALKIIKPGMDTRQVIARFEAERQALSLMDHPNIAKVLDAGTTESGQPYFVMELVNGRPITEYCDDKHLTLRQRLEFLLPVCQAIQHAHQKGLIHRDIKPSNILVAEYDQQAVPKVIDFGVAKAISQPLTEDSIFTGFGQIVGTLEYMSPEQAKFNQLDIDTRSDIYSLGVLMYELLTGSTPFDKKRFRSTAFDEMLRVIREEEPPKPSTKVGSSETLPAVASNRSMESARLSKLVRGELDWIVMKALEKDRSRRYETADRLARDIERYLRDEPVEACPLSVVYRIKKFVRRNKGPVVAAAVVLLTLLGGVFGTTWGLVRAVQARRAEAERAEGERRAKEETQTRLAQIEKATEILASVLRDLNPIAAEKAGVTSRDLLCRRLDKAAQQLEGEAVGDPLIVAGLQHLLGVTLRQLDRPELSEGVLVKAARTRERMLGANHLDTVATKHELAQAYRDARKYTQAEMLYKEVLATRLAQLGPDHLDTAATKHHLAWLYYRQKKYADAETLWKEALAIRTARLGANDLDTLATKHALAVLYKLQGKDALAEAMFKEVLAVRTAKLGDEHSDNLTSRQHLALLYRSQGKFELAEELLREVVSGRTAQLGADHRQTIHSQRYLGSLYTDQGKFDLAESLLKAVLATCTARLGTDDPETFTSEYDLAMLYRYMKKPEQAISLLEETLRRSKAAGASGTLKIQASLGAIYCEERRFADAIELLEEPHSKFRKDPELEWVGNALLKAYVGAGKPTEAISLATEQAGVARTELPADGPELAAALAPLGQALMKVGAYAEAEPLLLIAYKGFRQSHTQGPPKNDTRLRHAAERLVQLYDAWGKPDEAAKWRKEIEAARTTDRPVKPPAP